jgi:hypothetical protein
MSSHVSSREDHRSRAFDKRAQWRITGPKREAVRGGWTKLHNHGLVLYAVNTLLA